MQAGSARDQKARRAQRPGLQRETGSLPPGPTPALLVPQPARLARGLPGAPSPRAAHGAVTLDAGLMGHGGGRGLPAPALSAESGLGRRLQEVAASPPASTRHRPATRGRPAQLGRLRPRAPLSPSPRPAASATHSPELITPTAENPLARRFPPALCRGSLPWQLPPLPRPHHRETPRNPQDGFVLCCLLPSDPADIAIRWFSKKDAQKWK